MTATRRVSTRLGLLLLTTLAAGALVTPRAQAQPAPGALRAPSVPLVAVDPYFSIWSASDRLTDTATVHWTGRTHPLSSFIRVDGEPFRLMGVSPPTRRPCRSSQSSCTPHAPCTRSPVPVSA